MLRVTEANRAWWTLAGSCVGLFVLMLDSTVVVLALPSIQHDLDASNTALAWVQNGYLLSMAVLMVTAGRLGDMFGRKRIFLWSLAVFALGSVISALSQTEGVLVAGRIVQGAGGSGLIALSLALACNAFPAERQATAVGIWAGVSSLAMAIGPVARRVLRAPPRCPRVRGPQPRADRDRPGADRKLHLGLGVDEDAGAAGRRDRLPLCLLGGRAQGRAADRRLLALPQPLLLRGQRRRIRTRRLLLVGDVLPAAVPAERP